MSPEAPDPASPAYQIPDSTSVPARLRLLERLTDDATRTPGVQAITAAGEAAVGTAAAGAATPPTPGARDAALASDILTRVQALTYRPDPPGEWFQPAWYTVERGGDCEDLAVVLVGALRGAGLPAQVTWITQPGQRLNHVTAEVWLDGAWRWADPSIRGARVGESPYAALHRLQAWHVAGIAKPPGER